MLYEISECDWSSDVCSSDLTGNTLASGLSYLYQYAVLRLRAERETPMMVRMNEAKAEAMRLWRCV